jgi:hypothetical protein
MTLMIDQLNKEIWDTYTVIEKTTHRRGNALVLAVNLGPLQRESWAAQKIVSQLVQEEFLKS